VTTICSHCGKEINENSEVNKGKKYLVCRCGRGLVPRGANSFRNKEVGKNEVKGGGKMAKEETTIKTKKKNKVTRIAELLKENKCHAEIATIIKNEYECKCTPGYVAATEKYLKKK